MRINRSIANTNNPISKKNDLNHCASSDGNDLNNRAVVKFGELGTYTANIDTHNITIQDKLKEIEKRNNIVIIYACEVGSKAWGSDSKNSDNDIRFIYVSPKSKYYNNYHKDTIETELNDEYDIYGYDISKIIKQIKSQDYSPYEWLNSPIKYKNTSISEQLCFLSNSKTSLSNMKNSYKRTAISDYYKRLHNQQNINAKAYLFILKNIMMADFIDRRKKLPPLTYIELIDFYKCENPEIAQITQSLINIKKANIKKAEISRIPTLDKFIEEKIKEYSSLNLEKDSLSTKDNDELNDFLEQVINSYEFIEINKVRPTQEDIQRFELYPQDNEYRKKILSDMGLNEEDFLSIKSIIGPEELLDAIEQYNSMPDIYSVKPRILSQNGQIIPENVVQKKFRANLHTHTNHSDGKLTVQKLLDSAAKYADKIADLKDSVLNPQEPFIIAITDHNSFEGCKEAVQILRQNPDKYKNLRVVLGCELSVSEKKSGDYAPKKPYQIHLLAQCINPFDKNTNKLLDEKVNKENPSYTSMGTMKESIDIFRRQPDVLVGYAHPLKHQSYKKAPSKDKLGDIIRNLILKFKKAVGNRQAYVENYYQSYDTSLENSIELQNTIKEYCDEIGLLSAGGIDCHGDSIFFKK